MTIREFTALLVLYQAAREVAKAHYPSEECQNAIKWLDEAVDRADAMLPELQSLSDAVR